MSAQENRCEGMRPFETALAALAPRVEGFDRERLIFLAGRAAALRGWRWPAAFSAMTAVAAALLVMLCIRPQPKGLAGSRSSEGAANVSGTVPVPMEDGTRSLPDTVWLSPWTASPLPGRADATCGDSYAVLRQRMLRQGADSDRPREPASSPSTAVAEGPLPYHELLDRLLRKRPLAADGSGSMME